MTEETVGTLGGKSTRFGRRPLGASGRVIAAAMPVALWQDHQLVEVLRAVVDRRMRLRGYFTAATAWLRVHGRLAALLLGDVSFDKNVACASRQVLSRFGLIDTAGTSSGFAICVAGLDSGIGVAVPDFTDDIAGSIPNSAATSETRCCSLQHAGKSNLAKQWVGLANMQCLGDSLCLIGADAGPFRDG